MDSKPKKRGRKPKGGKILFVNNTIPKQLSISSNIILHLQCSSIDLKRSKFLSELHYNPIVETIEAYDSNMNDQYSTIENKNDNKDDYNNMNHQPISHDKNSRDTCNRIPEKLNNLKKRLNTSNSNKKSNCFWCTFSFNNHVIYIPKHIINNTFKVYGNFCSPSCAVAYLYNEKIDTSVKWERYSMLYSLYNDIYQYTSPIHPAPDPRYLLNDFMGSLSIDEYRELNQMNLSYIILNKPIIRIYPEIHEVHDNLDINQRFHSNLKSKTNMYRLSRNNKEHNKMLSL